MNWSIQRLTKGSGKARWHTVASGLPEYVAKTFGRDASVGSKTWHYRLLTPSGKKLTLLPTGAWVDKNCTELEQEWVEVAELKQERKEKDE